MTDLAQLIVSKRGLRQNTAQQYAQTVQRLEGICELQDFPDYSWLTEPTAMDLVLDHIDSLSTDSCLYYSNACLGALNALHDDSHPTILGIKMELQDRIRSANVDKKSKNMQQKLVGHESTRWKTAEELYENYKVLKELSERQPTRFMHHAKYLLYAIYIHMQDICVFRLDLVHKMSIGYRGSEMPTGNQLRLGKRGENATFFLTDYKTSKSHGEKCIEATPELTKILEDSYQRFPRSYLFPRERDLTEPMKPANANRFVKSCWVLSKTDDKSKPTSDDIRSALTTRFFKLHPDLISRDRFAYLSMSSTRHLELNYLKL